MDHLREFGPYSKTVLCISKKNIRINKKWRNTRSIRSYKKTCTKTHCTSLQQYHFLGVTKKERKKNSLSLSVSVRNVASSRKTTQSCTWKLDVVVNEAQYTAYGWKHLFADAPYLVALIPFLTLTTAAKKKDKKTIFCTRNADHLNDSLPDPICFSVLLKRSNTKYVQKALHAESVSEQGAKHKLRQSCCSEHPTYNLENEQRGGGKGQGV